MGIVGGGNKTADEVMQVELEAAQESEDDEMEESNEE